VFGRKRDCRYEAGEIPRKAIVFNRSQIESFFGEFIKLSGKALFSSNFISFAWYSHGLSTANIAGFVAVEKFGSEF
jgi:hypothetical protein